MSSRVQKLSHNVILIASSFCNSIAVLVNTFLYRQKTTVVATTTAISIVKAQELSR